MNPVQPTLFQRLPAIFRLGYSLAYAQIKLRNEGSYLGIFWYLLSPLCIFFILLFIKRVAFSPESIVNYPVYLLIGIIIYNFFSKLITRSITSIEKSGGLLKTVKFDPESLIVSELIQIVFSHIFEVLLVVILMLYLHIPLVGIIGYGIVLIFFILFASGFAFVTATIGAYISDFGNMWTIAAQILFFITPIFYVITPGSQLSFINAVNPLSYFLILFRDITMYGKIPSGNIMMITICISLITFFAGMYIFNEHKRKFAELS